MSTHIGILIIVLSACLWSSSSVHAFPQVIKAAYGVYAHPDDRTAQCLDDHNICIGNHYAAENEAHLRHIGVRYIVSAVGEPPARFSGMDYHVFRIEDIVTSDMTKHWEEAYEFIKSARVAHPHARIFVHCHAGVSRSASIVIYYLIRELGIDYDTALEMVRKHRHVVEPNARFERDLREVHSHRAYTEIHGLTASTPKRDFIQIRGYTRGTPHAVATIQVYTAYRDVCGSVVRTDDAICLTTATLDGNGHAEWECLTKTDPASYDATAVYAKASVEDNNGNAGIDETVVVSAVLKK